MLFEFRKKEWKSENSIPQSSCDFGDVMIQIACLDAQEAIAMLSFSPGCLEQEIRKCLKMVTMENLILQNSCYSPIPSIKTPSKWCLECFWSKILMPLVEVLEIWSLCDKLHFQGILKGDFEK